MSKFTPGKWAVSSYQKTKSRRCVFEGPHGMLGWVGTDRDQGLYEEAEANALLIAAAPELFSNNNYLDDLISEICLNSGIDLKQLDDDELITLTITAKAAKDIKRAVEKVNK